MAPFITNDLNPTPPKTGGDDHFEPAVMRGAGVVMFAKHRHYSDMNLGEVSFDMDLDKVAKGIVARITCWQK